MISEKNFDDKLSGLITFHLYFMAGKNILVSASNTLFSFNSIINILCMAILVFAYLHFFIKFKPLSHISIRSTIFAAIIVLFLLFSILNNLYLIEDRNVTDRIKAFVVYCLPMYFCFSLLSEPELLFKKLVRYSDWIFVIASISAFLFITSGKTTQIDSSYDMSFGNNLLIVIIILAFDYHKNERIKSLIISLILTLYILFMASRGPLLSIAITYIIIILMDIGKAKSAYIHFIKILFTFFISYIIIFYKDFLMALQRICESFGIESRTISRLGSLYWMTYESGRERYHEEIKQALNGKILGLGAFGGEKCVGLSHGLYWDVFANFGYYVGGGVLAFLLINYFRYFFRSVKPDLKYFMLAFGIIVIPRGFFDQTLWGTYELWIIISMLLNSTVQNLDNNKAIDNSVERGNSIG